MRNDVCPTKVILALHPADAVFGQEEQRVPMAQVWIDAWRLVLAQWWQSG